MAKLGTNINLEQFQKMKSEFASYYIWSENKIKTSFLQQVLSSDKEKAIEVFKKDQERHLLLYEHKAFLLTKEGEVIACVPENMEALNSFPFNDISAPNIPNLKPEPLIKHAWRSFNSIPYYQEDFLQ